MQLGNEEAVFLIDMISLKESETFDKVMEYLFNHQKIKIISFSFKNDIKELHTRAPTLKFINRMSNLYDIEEMYLNIYGIQEKTSLNKIAEHILNK